jgi:hypothetical protein
MRMASYTPLAGHFPQNLLTKDHIVVSNYTERTRSLR